MIYYALGSTQITVEELFIPSASGKIAGFTTDLLKKNVIDQIFDRSARPKKLRQKFQFDDE